MKVRIVVAIALILFVKAECTPCRGTVVRRAKNIEAVSSRKRKQEDEEKKKLEELRRAHDLHLQEVIRMQNETRKVEAWIKEQDEIIAAKVKNAKTMKVKVGCQRR